ncbi:MAG: MOSC domain-containing protein [Campylobacterales bacterium]|nr:MOSC domain-containing protein [Campylobacterales bacterium]
MVYSDMGKVLQLFISQPGNSERIPQQTLSLDTKGIIGDKFYDKDIDRSILVTSEYSYAVVHNENISMEFGALGENILLDYNPYHLNSGQKLKIGEAILEVSQNCTMCNHLSKIDKKVPKLLRDDRGIFVKVIQNGDIHVGDPVQLLN